MHKFIHKFSFKATANIGLYIYFIINNIIFMLYNFTGSFLVYESKVKSVFIAAKLIN